MNSVRFRAVLDTCFTSRFRNLFHLFKTEIFPASSFISKRFITNKDLRQVPVVEKYRSSSMDILDNLYSPDVTKLILERINNWSLEELRDRKISKYLTQGILSKRPFEKISDMLELPNSDGIKISRMCDQMKRVSRTSKNYRTDRFTINKLSIEKIKTIKIITSLHHDFRGATWFTMTTDCNFITMGSIEFETSLKYRHEIHLDLFAEQVQGVVDGLPPSDIIVMCERVKTTSGSKLLGKLENSLNALDGTLFGLMLGRGKSDMVTTLRFSVLNRAFSLTCGEDMVSVAAQVRNILDSGVIDGVQIQNVEALRNNFENSPEVTQERRARIILTHIAFNNQIKNALEIDAKKARDSQTD